VVGPGRADKQGSEQLPTLVSLLADGQREQHFPRTGERAQGAAVIEMDRPGETRGPRHPYQYR
jgi:hypothetical protein